MELVDRFWSKVDKRSRDECWCWLAYRDRHGYGQFVLKDGIRRTNRAHVVSYILEFGWPPENSFVCHQCDTPSCVNPYHLFLGNADLNAKDCVLKGRTAAGEKCGKSKLTAEQVRTIRQRYLDLPIIDKDGRRAGVVKLAEEYGVVYNNVVDIVKRKTWKSV